MADTNYVVSYDTSSAVKAAKNIDAFTASVVKHDAAVVSDLAAAKRLTAAYNDLATAAGKATKMVDKAAASMAAATAQGTAFAANLTGAAVAALDLEKGATTAAAATAKAGRAMDKTGTSAKAAAVGIDAAAMAARASNIPIGAMGAAASTAGSKFRAFSKAATTAATGLGNTTTAANAATAALNGTATAGTAAKAGLQGVGKAATGSVNGVKALGMSLTGLVSTAVALGVLKKVVGELGDAIKEAREFDKDSAEGNFDKREAARELAFNMGENGPNDKVMGRVFGTAVASGMSFKEALTHNQELEGSIVAGVLKGNVREDQKEEIAKATAVVARRAGLDAKTAGDMTGTITQFENFNTDKNGKPISAEQAGKMIAAKMDSIVTGLAAGRGSVSTLARGEISQSMSAVGSGRATLDEMTGLVSTASNFAKSASGTGTKYSQISALINRPDESTKEFMAASGVGGAQGDVAKLQALKRYVDAAKPKGIDTNTWLNEQGFHAKGEREAIVSILPFVGSKDAPNVLEKQIAEAQKNAGDLEGTKARNAAYMATGPAQHDVANAKVETATYEHGKKTENLVTARLNAVAQLIDEGVYKEKTQVMADKLRGGFGLAEFAGLQSGEQQRIDERVAQNALAAAKDAGVSVFLSPDAQKGITNGQDSAPIDLTSDRIPGSTSKTTPGYLAELGATYLKQDPEEAARVLNDLTAKGVPITGSSGIAAKQKSADRDPGKAAAWEAAKQMRPGAKTQPVDLKATPREPASPAPGLMMGPRKVQGGTAGPENSELVAKVDASSLDKAARDLSSAANAIQTAMQQASMPGLPNGFGDFGAYRT